MTIKNIQGIVLGAGASKRFQIGKTKLTEKICGKEMIAYPLQLLESLSIPTSLVIGFQKETIKKVLKNLRLSNITLIEQKDQLGSGHAASLTKTTWNKDHILLMNGDIPLLTQEVIQKLYNKHIKSDADISFVTAHGIDFDNKNYCRIMINNNKIHVLEQTDTTTNPDSQCCISAGIYIAKKSFLEKHMDSLSKSNLTGEYYLPELVQIASDNNCKIVTTPASFDVIRTVDTLSDLWVVEHIKRSQLIKHWMNNGVRFANSLNVMIDESTTIEPGCFIGSGAHLLGKTIIKKGSTIGAYSCITSCTIEANSIIHPHVVMTKSTVKEKSEVQPFTHLDNGTVIDSKITKNNSLTFTGAVKTSSIDKQKEI